MSEILKALIVDDEPGMVSGMERTLQNCRVEMPDIGAEVTFTIRTATSGEEALELIEQEEPDILLLDHKLPGMSGLDVLHRIEDRKDNILTVMVTAYASLDTAVTAVKRGAYDFLAKPFTPAELKAVVHRATQSIINARQARALAKERRQVRFQFISVLAHELKAPLAAIKGYLDIIQKKAAGDNPAVYDEMLSRCGVRLDGMQKLIMDLLDLTRIESGQKKRELRNVAIDERIHHAMELVVPQAVERKIDVRFQSDGDLAIQADPGEIDIILNNLISNAVKYNRDGGKVTIQARQKDNHIVITVADTGIGMSEEECKRLFQDFVRIKNEKNEKYSR